MNEARHGSIKLRCWGGLTGILFAACVLAASDPSVREGARPDQIGDFYLNNQQAMGVTLTLIGIGYVCFSISAPPFTQRDAACGASPEIHGDADAHLSNADNQLLCAGTGPTGLYIHLVNGWLAEEYDRASAVIDAEVFFAAAWRRHVQAHPRVLDTALAVPGAGRPQPSTTTDTDPTGHRRT